MRGGENPSRWIGNALKGNWTHIAYALASPLTCLLTYTKALCTPSTGWKCSHCGNWWKNPWKDLNWITKKIWRIDWNMKYKAQWTSASWHDSTMSDTERNTRAFLLKGMHAQFISSILILISVPQYYFLRMDAIRDKWFEYMQWKCTNPWKCTNSYLTLTLTLRPRSNHTKRTRYSINSVSQTRHSSHNAS